MKRFFALLCLFVSCLSVFAQAPNHPSPRIIRCLEHELVEVRDRQQPGYKAAVDATFEQAATRVAHQQTSSRDGEIVYRIPVVVHIIYNTAAENLSDAVVATQIDKLNEDYRRMNADTTNTRPVFQPVAADANIEFYLANIDPDGNPTNGITRTQTDRTDFSSLAGIDPLSILTDLQACGLTINEIMGLFGFGTPPNLTAAEEACVNEVLASFGGGMDEMKDDATGGHDAWDTDRYMNIWVCDLNGDNPSLGLILGFAYPPVGAPNWPAGQNGTAQTDGVCIHYQAFGNSTSNTAIFSPFSDDGRTTVHEVGHYLGLRHIWGDDACGIDDGISDTPDSDAASDAASGCNWSQNNCTGDGSPDQPDMIENYMDYSSDECQNLFTRGQVAIMRAMLEGPRNGLLWQNVLEAPNADFVANATNVIINTPIQFSDLSANVPVSWYWDFGDGGSSTEQNPLHTYAIAGTYNVTLTVENSFGFDFETKSAYITVNNPVGYDGSVLPQFNVLPNPTKGNVQVHLTNAHNAQVAVFNAVGAKVYENQMDEQLQFQLPTAGIYMVKVTANGLSNMTKLVVE